MDIDQVKSVLRATLLSCKGSITLRQCNRDYKELQGEPIPYQKLGFKSLDELFKDLPGFRLYNNGGEWTVDAIASRETQHIAAMVSRQKSAAPRKSAMKNRYPSRFPSKPDPWRSYSNGTKPSYPPPSSSSRSYFAPKGRNYNSPPKNFNKPPKLMDPNTRSTDVRAKKPFESRDNESQLNKPTKPNRYDDQYARQSEPPARQSEAPSRQMEPSVQANKSRVGNESANSQSETNNRHSERQSPQPTAPANANSRTVTGTTVTINKTSQSKDVSSNSFRRNYNNNKVGHEPKRERMSVSQRLLDVQKAYSTTLPLQLPASSAPPEPPAPSPVLEPPAELRVPNTPLPDTPKERLDWLCEFYGLEAAEFKSQEHQPKHGPKAYDSTIKVGNYSSTSYPDSAPSREAAMTAAAVKMLALLESKGFSANASQPIPVSNPQVAMDRIADIVSIHTAGIWAINIPDSYRSMYKEKLPSNWQEMLELCPRITIDYMVGQRKLLLPRTADNQSELSLGGSPPRASSPPALQLLLDEPYWNVYITVANSPIEVWLRIIGEPYSDALESLLKDMELYYISNGMPVTQPVEESWYAVHLGGSGWHRAKALELRESELLVFLADHGDEELVPLSALRELAPQFCRLPAQAILCRLVGVEEFATSPHAAQLVSTLVDRVLVAEPAGQQAIGDDQVALTLYDTSTDRDVNLNQDLVKQFCNAAMPPTISMRPCEVEVTCISEEGRVWLCSAAGGGLQTLAGALTFLTDPNNGKTLPAPPAVPVPDQLYVVQTESGEWLRCQARGGQNSDNIVAVRLVDSGRMMRAPLSHLVPLAPLSPTLAKFPVQAIQVWLADTPVPPALVPRMREMLTGQQGVCRLPTSPGREDAPHPSNAPSVELFVRIKPKNILASVNNALRLEWELLKDGASATLQKELQIVHVDPVAELNRKKERIFSRGGSASAMLPPIAASSYPAGDVPASEPLPLLEMPELKTYYDVYVAMAANPWNFVVQPYKSRSELKQLMAELQGVCPGLPESYAPVCPRAGEVYAAHYHKDNTWYRVIINTTVSGDMVSVNFCDFGELALVPNSCLRPLPYKQIPVARSLPPQAMKAKMHDVSPLHSDWSVEDCVRFQALTVEQQFVSVVWSVSQDPLHPGEPLLLMDLIDVSTDNDLYLNKQLAAEGRATIPSTQHT